MSTEHAELAAIREDMIGRGQKIYDERLKAVLERDHFGRFAALDHETGRCFLGDTSVEATGAAHDAMPESSF